MNISDLVDLKRQYNELLNRCEQAKRYFSNEKIPDEDKDKYRPEIYKITDKMDEVLREIRNEEGELKVQNIVEGWDNV